MRMCMWVNQSFVNVMDYATVDEAIERIRYLDNNDDAYVAMLQGHTYIGHNCIGHDCTGTSPCSRNRGSMATICTRRGDVPDLIRCGPSPGRIWTEFQHDVDRSPGKTWTQS